METEGAVGAAVQPPVENTTGVQTTSEPTPKEPSKFRRVLNFLSGKNHEHPSQIHEDLQTKKDGAAAPADQTPQVGGTIDTASGDTSPAVAALAAETIAAPTSDLAPIGDAPGVAKKDEVQTPTGNIDAMITKLQETVKDDDTPEGGVTASPAAPAPEPVKSSIPEDTGAALDAMTASLAKMPEADSSTAEPDVAPKDEEPAESPAPTIPTGTLASAPVTPVQTADPVTEAPIGIKSAATTTAVPSEAPSNVVNFQDAGARIQGAKDQTNPDVPTTNPAPAEQPTAPTTPLPKAA